MSPRIVVTETESVKTEALPPAPVKKWLLAQWRFWVLLLALGLNVSMLVFVFGLSFKEALGDDKSVMIVGIIVTALLHAAGYAFTIKGSLPTAITRRGGRPLPQLPTVTATTETSTTTETEASNYVSEYDRMRAEPKTRNQTRPRDP